MVPSFQRQFIWKKDKVIAFLESLFNGIPIPSLLIWNYSGSAVEGCELYKVFNGQGNVDYSKFNKNFQKPKQGIKISNNDSAYNNFHHYYYIIVDGQQRISSIAYAFKKENSIYVELTNDGEWKFYVKKDNENCVALCDIFEKDTNSFNNNEIRIYDKIKDVCLVGYDCPKDKNFEEICDIFKKINLKPKGLETGDIFSTQIHLKNKSVGTVLANLIKQNKFKPNIICNLFFIISNLVPGVKLSNFTDENLDKIINTISKKEYNSVDNINKIVKSSLKNNDQLEEFIKQYNTVFVCYFSLYFKFQQKCSIKYLLLLLLLLKVGKANSQGIIYDFYNKISEKEDIPSYVDVIEFLLPKDSSFIRNNGEKDLIRTYINWVVETNIDTNINKVLLYCCCMDDHTVELNKDLDHLHPINSFSGVERTDNHPSNKVYNMQLLHSTWNNKKGAHGLSEWMRDMKLHPGNTHPSFVLDPVRDNSDISYEFNDKQKFWNKRKEMIIETLIEFFK